MLELEGVSKSFRGPQGEVKALEDITCRVLPGERVAVHGPSGCGKTTLLLIAGGLLHPDRGDVRLGGVNPYQLTPNHRSALRAQRIGFVFQHFHLVPYLTVLENILAPSIAQICDETHQRAEQLLREFKLEQRAHHVPGQLSVGEQQRTALARAMLHRPDLLLADEPTGNLDEDNARIVLRFLAEFAHRGGAVLLVTHDARAMEYATRTITLRQGRIVDVATLGIGGKTIRTRQAIVEVHAPRKSAPEKSMVKD